jgi:hypothetical protein
VDWQHACGASIVVPCAFVRCQFTVVLIFTGRACICILGKLYVCTHLFILSHAQDTSTVAGRASGTLSAVLADAPFISVVELLVLLCECICDEAMLPTSMTHRQGVLCASGRYDLFSTHPFRH